MTPSATGLERESAGAPSPFPAGCLDSSPNKSLLAKARTPVPHGVDACESHDNRKATPGGFGNDRCSARLHFLGARGPTPHAACCLVSRKGTALPGTPSPGNEACRGIYLQPPLDEGSLTHQPRQKCFCMFFLILSINHIISQSRQPVSRAQMPSGRRSAGRCCRSPKSGSGRRGS